MQLSRLTAGTVIASGVRLVTEREIVEFDSRFLAASASIERKRGAEGRSTDTTASVWMICAIAECLASSAALRELWSAHRSFIERLVWCDAVRPGDEVQLRIEVLEKCLSATGLAAWVRWRWILTTMRGGRALDLVAGSLLEDLSVDRSIPSASPPRISYKISEAAKLVGLSRYVLYDAIRNRELPAYRPSRRSDLVSPPRGCADLGYAFPSPRQVVHSAAVERCG